MSMFACPAGSFELRILTALLAVCLFSHHASAEEEITLKDGRVLTGTYEPERGIVTLAGKIKGTIAVRPEDIVSRRTVVSENEAIEKRLAELAAQAKTPNGACNLVAAVLSEPALGRRYFKVDDMEWMGGPEYLLLLEVLNAGGAGTTSRGKDVIHVLTLMGAEVASKREGVIKPDRLIEEIDNLDPITPVGAKRLAELSDEGVSRAEVRLWERAGEATGPELDIEFMQQRLPAAIARYGYNPEVVFNARLYAKTRPALKAAVLLGAWQGDPLAVAEYAEHLYHGVLLGKNPILARRCAERAAPWNINAQYMLGRFQWHGIGGPEDIELSLETLRAALARDANGSHDYIMMALAQHPLVAESDQIEYLKQLSGNKFGAVNGDLARRILALVESERLTVSQATVRVAGELTRMGLDVFSARDPYNTPPTLP